MKKLMAIVLCAAMLASILCVNAFANTATNVAANATVSVSYVDTTKTEPALSDTRLNLVNDGDYETNSNASAYWKTENGPIMVTVKLDKVYAIDHIFLATENWYIQGTNELHHTQKLQFEAKVNGEWTAITEKFDDVERAGVESIDQAKNLVPNDIELDNYVVTDEIRLVFHECTRAYFNVKEIMLYGVEYDATNPPVKATATIGTTEYATVEAALEAAQAGETVTLVKNVTLTATLTINKSVTLDGNGKTLTANGFNAINVQGDSLNVTIKNVKIATDKVGVNLVSCTSADVKSKLTIEGVESVSTGGNGMNAEMYWDFDMDRCTLVGNYGLHCTKDNSANVITIDDSVLTGNSKYAAYFRSASTITITNSTLTSKLDSSMASDTLSAVQIKTSTADTPTTLTFNNCNVTSFGGYVIAVNPYNKVYINGGTYQITPPDGCKARDAVVNVGNANAYCKITDGTFKTNTNCNVRAYGDNSVLDIEGGTFIYDNATGGGSPVRAGTGTAKGTVNISGGHFITNGVAPVLNTVIDGGVINVSGGIFENNGENIIPLIAKSYDGVVSNATEFPAGLKKVEFKNGAYVDPNASADTTTTAPADTTTEGPTDNTTAPVDGTTAPEADETTTAIPDNTTKAPENTTKAPEEPAKKSCGSFALAAQLVMILGAAVTVVIIKKK